MAVVGGFETRPYKCRWLWQSVMNGRVWNLQAHIQETTMTNLSPHQKAQTLILLCEKALPFLHENAVIERAQAAIQEMKNWSPDRNASGLPLGDLLMDESEEGLVSDEFEARTPEIRAAILLIGYAAAYVSWHLSRQSGEIPHTTVTDVSEETYELALAEADRLKLKA